MYDADVLVFDRYFC